MTGAHAKGRPLRFLLVVLLCWTAGRVAISQDWSAPARSVDVALKVRELPGVTDIKLTAITLPLWIKTSLPTANWTLPARSHIAGLATSHALPVIGSSVVPMTYGVREERKNDAPPVERSPFASAPLMPERIAAGRWSLSTWVFWRHAGAGNSLATVGQLGGSQAGARLAFQILPGAPERLALYARMTSAMTPPHAPEAALGFSVQPSAKVPVRVAVERRIALDHDARNAMAVMAVGGFGPAAVTNGFTLEGYGQAGIVGVHSRDAFADGKLSLQHPLPVTLPITVGISISGGAQPHVARLDIGPQVEARFRIGLQGARLSAEWRQRVAGDARPGSGPAVTLAADF